MTTTLQDALLAVTAAVTQGPPTEPDRHVRAGWSPSTAAYVAWLEAQHNLIVAGLAQTSADAPALVLDARLLAAVQAFTTAYYAARDAGTSHSPALARALQAALATDRAAREAPAPEDLTGLAHLSPEDRAQLAVLAAYVSPAESNQRGPYLGPESA